MKNYIKGIITGIIIGAVVCSIPALADTIDALFNNVRISVNGVDQIQWDENIKLSDGAETPASILVGGTTYLPMRKLGELSGNKIYWNGDSRTVGMTGAQKDIKVIAEKPDKNGNVWEYYTFKTKGYSDDISYLGVKDENRGYDRVYRTIGNVKITDEAVYFIRRGEKSSNYYGTLTKLSYDSDADTQDGEILYKSPNFREGDILNEGYIYYIDEIPTLAGYNELCVYNYLTDSEVRYKSPYSGEKLYVTDVEETETQIIFKCDVTHTYETVGTSTVVYDKITDSFVNYSGEIK